MLLGEGLERLWNLKVVRKLFWRRAKSFEFETARTWNLQAGRVMHWKESLNWQEKRSEELFFSLLQAYQFLLGKRMKTVQWRSRAFVFQPLVKKLRRMIVRLGRDTSIFLQVWSLLNLGTVGEMICSSHIKSLSWRLTREKLSAFFIFCYVEDPDWFLRMGMEWVVARKDVTRMTILQPYEKMYVVRCNEFLATNFLSYASDHLDDKFFWLWT